MKHPGAPLALAVTMEGRAWASRVMYFKSACMSWIYKNVCTWAHTWALCRRVDEYRVWCILCELVLTHYIYCVCVHLHIARARVCALIYIYIYIYIYIIHTHICVCVCIACVPTYILCVCTNISSRSGCAYGLPAHEWQFLCLVCVFACRLSLAVPKDYQRMSDKSHFILMPRVCICMPIISGCGHARHVCVYMFKNIKCTRVCTCLLVYFGIQTSIFSRLSGRTWREAASTEVVLLTSLFYILFHWCAKICFLRACT